MKGILTDSTGDLLFQNGKLVIGECSADVAERVLRAHPGEIKSSPLLGLFATAHINGTIDPFWRGRAKRQLAQVGVKVKDIIVDNGNITIDIDETD